MRVLATGLLLALSLGPSGSLSVSRAAHVTDGEQISVSGAGFAPLSGLLVGQCGPDGTCNDQGGVQPVSTDATGSFGPVPLLLAVRFGAVDCSVATCAIVARAASGAPDPVTVPITFAEPGSGTPALGVDARSSTGATASPATATTPWAPMAILATALAATVALALILRSRHRLGREPAGS